ncbi:MAG: YggS family pyridoxal phosphate-dependent enzyme [Pseudomonadota bacterium]
MSIADNIESVRSKIESACRSSQRDPANVHLLAVSKTRSAEEVDVAVQAGLCHFGENYLQDALGKVERVTPQVSWHFIGAIQSNKTRLIAEHFSWVHTLSSQKVARRLNEQRPEHLPALKTLIQVNIDNDPDKAGLAANEVGEFLHKIRDFKQLHICGLMTIPGKPGEGARPTTEPFAQLRGLRDDLRLDYPKLTELSMGMSGDLEAAISEGATWVRIGTAIFGPRN